MVDLGNGFRFQVSVSYAGPSTGFLKRAKKLELQDVANAKPVPFQAYWSTHEDMDEAQLRWFLHWRGRFRAGRSLPTDLSYVFVHAYELIHLVGVRDAAHAHAELKRLWLQYREQHRRLDNYLPGWILDLAAVHACHSDPYAPFRELLAAGGPIQFSESVLPAFLNRPLSELPMPLIESLSDAKPTLSRFYRDGNRELVNTYLPLAFERVDAALRETSGVGVFSAFGSLAPVREARQAFQGAVYDLPARKWTRVFVPYHRHEPLRELFTAVCKHTENRLRESTGYSGRLRGYELDETMRLAIDALIPVVAPVAKGKRGAKPARPSPVPMPTRRVEIDLAQVRELTQESDEVRAMLLAGLGDANHEPTESVSPDAVPLAAGSPADRAEPDGALPGSAALAGPWHELVARLDAAQLAALRAVASGAGARAAVAEIAREHLLMPAALIDAINAIADEVLGDVLIEVHNEEPTVLEDYLPDLRRLLAARAAVGA